MDKDIENAVKVLEKEGSDLSFRLGQLHRTFSYEFGTANNWPFVLDKFTTLGKSPYSNLNAALDGRLDDQLLKPVAMENDLQPHAFEELFSWRIEDSLQASMNQALASEYELREGLVDKMDYQDIINDLDEELKAHNTMIKDLTVAFKEEQDKYQRVDIPRLMPDKALLSQLLVYDSAVRIGGGIIEKQLQDVPVSPVKGSATPKQRVARTMRSSRVTSDEELQAAYFAESQKIVAEREAKLKAEAGLIKQEPQPQKPQANIKQQSR